MIKGNNKTSRKFTVYVHKSPSGKAYVGITCQQLKDRWGENGYRYFKINKKGRMPHKALASAITKYGWNNFKHIIVAKDISENRAKSLEKDLIRHYKNLGLSYNITDGGEGSLGRTVSEETREKIRKGHLGKKLSEEHKRKIGLKSLGRKHTQEEKEKISRANKGKEVPEDRRKRISKTLKGRPGNRLGMVNSPETRAKISASKRANPRHHTKEEKEHLSRLFKGRKNSPETIEKMKKAKLLYWKKKKENDESIKKMA